MDPWIGGINSSQDESEIQPNQLTQADNVIFDTRGSRRRRDAIDFDFDDGTSGTDSA